MPRTNSAANALRRGADRADATSARRIAVAALALMAGFSSACAPETVVELASNQPGSSDTSEVPDGATGLEQESGRALFDPASDDDGVLRVLVYHDMEGLAGQDDTETFRYSHPDKYVRGRRYLTDDVNAVIAGLYQGGADEVHVVDAHGSGNPEPDLLLDELDARAQMVFRETPFRQYVDLVEPGVYDAVAVVGMHAKTGSGGFASHTYTLGIAIEMNGMEITETEIIGYSWGRVGVPVISAPATIGLPPTWPRCRGSNSSR